jgi:fructuronate reductase
VQRLCDETISRLRTAVALPTYDRGRLQPRWAHVGVGAFHRCHQAEYLDELAARHDGTWGLVGVNIREPDVLPILSEQDGLYTRILRGPHGDDARVIGSIIDTVAANETRAPVTVLASPEVSIASFTITEKGYCHIPSTGEPDPTNADLAADLDPSTQFERSVPGIVARSLHERSLNDAGPISLMSCDNVPGNGRVLEGMVRCVTRARWPDLEPWIDDNVGFVSTMVDRIVPATLPEESVAISEQLGVIDLAPVVGEDFRQWVIEDSFSASRPQLEQVGVVFTDDVEPYEIVKMRVVNGAQSLLCYLGALAGIPTIWQAMANPTLNTLVRLQLERDVQPWLPKVHFDIDDYRRTLLDRLANPHISHTSHQIATDGSRKIVPRFVRPLGQALRSGGRAPTLSLGIAAWLRYQQGLDDEGNKFTVNDPANGRIKTLVETSGLRPARAAVSDAAIFGDLGDLEVIVQEIDEHYARIVEHGALEAAKACLDPHSEDMK